MYVPFFMKLTAIGFQLLYNTSATSKNVIARSETTKQSLVYVVRLPRSPWSLAMTME